MSRQRAARRPWQSVCPAATFLLLTRALLSIRKFIFLVICRGSVAPSRVRPIKIYGHIITSRLAASFVPSKSYYIIFLAKDPSYSCVKCKLIIPRCEMFCLFAEFLLCILFCKLQMDGVTCKELNCF